jgi:cytochrome c oxidase accessory protein FixG
MKIPSKPSTQRASGARLWVYPREFPGQFRRIHHVTSAILILFLVVVPWIRVGGHPALNIDMQGRKLWFLGTLFTASDGILLLLMGLFASFALFFFTSLFGRLWCGYACPHSVFLLNLVLPIERWLEGTRGAQKLRDQKGGWAPTWRKVLKWGVYVVAAWALSMFFMGFFSEPLELWTGQASPMAYSVVLFFTALWAFDFIFFREQLCNYLCPYARFQSALMDNDSLAVTYAGSVGEPRARGKAAVAENRCIDCNWCVDACPQGIDIRNGFQLECIACGRCVDACTSIHDRVGGSSLIDYRAADGGTLKWIRKRTVVYAALLCALTAAFVGVLAARRDFDVSVQRAPGSLYAVDDDGSVRNTYLARVTNMGSEPRTYTFDTEGIDNAELTVPTLFLQPEETRIAPLVLRVDGASIDARTVAFTFGVSQGEGVIWVPATFKTPAAMSGR